MYFAKLSDKTFKQKKNSWMNEYISNLNGTVNVQFVEFSIATFW